ncbi:MAG TPA: hypothetical protein VK190_02695 [Pseudoneobacillus sp.]|jgi:hypothetical protein|nr:hypothetical protein [Pseudoneobacillus sp.]
MNSFSRGKRGTAGDLVYGTLDMPKVILIKVPVDNKYAYFVWHSILETGHFHNFLILEELFVLKLKYGSDISVEDFMYVSASIQNHVRGILRTIYKNKLEDKYLISEEEL